MAISNVDLKKAHYNPNDRANGWSFNPNVGVTIRHLPTGLEASSGMFATRVENEAAALRKLEEALQKFNTSESGEINLLQVKKDLESGMMVSPNTWRRVLDVAIKLTEEKESKNEQ